MISVVIPVLDGEATIGHQLRALSKQEMDVPWEVVVADNGSTDGTAAEVANFNGVLPGLRLVDASCRRGPAAARNIGVESTRGDVLAFCDADDVVAPGWLAALAAATEEHDFVAGCLNFNFRWLTEGLPEAQRAPVWAPTTGAFRWLPYALGANMAVSRRAFLEVGGFAESLHAGEDLDLSWRLQINGYPLQYVPDALVHKRPRPTNRGVMRQNINYGRHDVILYKRLRSAGMPRRSLGMQVRLYGWLVLNVWRLVAGGRGRLTWVISASAALGRVIGSVEHRTLFL